MAIGKYFGVTFVMSGKGLLDKIIIDLSKILARSIEIYRSNI